jgi:hypothetical protein
MGKNYKGTEHHPNGYYDSSKPKGKLQRRPLPKVDLSKCEDDPEWLDWKDCPPQQPGWYWVACEHLWPQIVEWRMVKGVLRAIDRHSDGLWGENFWEFCAGPIPDPVSTSMLYFRKRGRR